MSNSIKTRAFSVLWLSMIFFPIATLSFDTFSDSKDVISSIDLDYDFYEKTCPSAHEIVRSTMSKIFDDRKDAPAALLRLLFHDCFIQGCDASVLLDDGYGNNTQRSEKQAIPNRTLKGFDTVDMIKEELEKACPGVVSCADLLVLATRDGIVLSGGPYYPALTGRKDSTQSYYMEATTEIPAPDGSISESLRSFSVRGFNEREMVSLLGGHNIGKIGCEFIQSRLNNFKGTSKPDPTIAPGFLNEIHQSCNVSDRNRLPPSPTRSRQLGESLSSSSSSPTRSRQLGESSSSTRSRQLGESSSSLSMTYFQGLSTFVPSGSGFDTHYYQSLLQGRGLLFADQQLMADQKTARFVSAYASDDGTTFRRDFARVMIKLSNLGTLTGSQGQVRLNCSVPVSSH